MKSEELADKVLKLLREDYGEEILHVPFDKALEQDKELRNLIAHLFDRVCAPFPMICRDSQGNKVVLKFTELYLEYDPDYSWLEVQLLAYPQAPVRLLTATLDTTSWVERTVEEIVKWIALRLCECVEWKLRPLITD